MSFEMIYGILFILLVVAVGLWFLGETRPIKIIVVQEHPAPMIHSDNESRSVTTPYGEMRISVRVIDIKV